MREHDLKCSPEPFRAVREGRKRHETRHNDRGYQVGDVLVLREWVPNFRVDRPLPAGGQYTGEVERRVVTYVTPGGEWGIPDHLCVMSLQVEYPLATATDALRWWAVRQDLQVVSVFAGKDYYLTGGTFLQHDDLPDLTPDAFADALTKRRLANPPHPRAHETRTRTMD